MLLSTVSSISRTLPSTMGIPNNNSSVSPISRALPSISGFLNTTDIPPNSTEYKEPIAEFDDSYWVRIIVDSFIFVISMAANIAVMTTLLVNRRRKSRVNMLILHLITADLLITLVNIPTDIAWHLTVVWIAGNAMCKIIMFLNQVFMSASGFLLIVISLDRYAAIVHPLSVSQADKRCKIMLRVAWMVAVIFALPQLYIQETQSHPEDPTFIQCVDFRFKENNRISWILWHVFVTLYTYVCPLWVIITCYSVIVYTIYSKGKKFCEAKNGNVELRKSGSDCIPKARMRALQMTAILVSAFIICWTPYFVISTVYHIDETFRFPGWISEASFALGYANSCVDPIVYGMFTINFSREFQRCCARARGRKRGGDGYKSSRYWRAQSTTNQPMSTRLGMTSLSHPDGASQTQPESSEGKQTNFINNVGS
ncbi:gonadotropin-releasing hormone II receptor-like [Amphiura filiformis]|uniref:gonadotropin-releasing hormone II receptor-like n=1 Tax=Amphiura filiformis TaxID=82378 RepID=UPI003B212CAA